MILEVSKIVSVEKKMQSMIFSIETHLSENEVKLGDSVSINGVCQTVIKKEKNILTFESMFETMNSTTFSNFKKGSYVNIELAMKPNDRFGGHIVSGHVDTKGKILSIKEIDNSKVFRIETDSNLVIEKGSISIDGISLTVQNLYNDGFDVAILPYTFLNTNLKHLKEGEYVNIEFDMIAKYLKKFMEPEKKSKITKEFLIENGF